MDKLSKKELYDLVAEIVKNEKFKQDAFFFCGYPTGSPDEELIPVCNAYLESIDSGNESAEVRENLVAAMEKALSKEPARADKANITSSDSNIRKVLDSKDNL